MNYGILLQMDSMIKVNTVISQLLTQLKQLRQIRTTTDKQRNKALVTVNKTWNMYKQVIMLQLQTQVIQPGNLKSTMTKDGGSHTNSET